MSVVGSHSVDFPVENLKLLRNAPCDDTGGDRQLLLASGSYDWVRFWSVSEIPKVWTKDVEDEEKGEGKKGGRKRRRNRRRKEMLEVSKEPKKGNNFFEDLV